MHRISHCHTKLSLGIGLGKNRNTQSTSCVITLQRVEQPFLGHAANFLGRLTFWRATPAMQMLQLFAANVLADLLVA